MIMMRILKLWLKQGPNDVVSFLKVVVATFAKEILALARFGNETGLECAGRPARSRW
jgi:hypothetical protein